MELLGSDDIKRELIKKSARHREELESEIRLISDRTEKVLINALIIGGSLAATYFIVRQLSSSSSTKTTKVKKVKPKKAKKVVQYDDDVEEVETVYESAAPGLLAQVGTAVASQATALLLSLAKEKLMDFIQTQLSKEKES